MISPLPSFKKTAAPLEIVDMGGWPMLGGTASTPNDHTIDYIGAPAPWNNNSIYLYASLFTNPGPTQVINGYPTGVTCENISGGIRLSWDIGLYQMTNGKAYNMFIGNDGLASAGQTGTFVAQF